LKKFTIKNRFTIETNFGRQSSRQGEPPALQKALKNKKLIILPLFLGDHFGLPGSGFETMPTRFYGKCVLFM
jgi:hypothetical protein